MTYVTIPFAAHERLRELSLCGKLDDSKTVFHENNTVTFQISDNTAEQLVAAFPGRSPSEAAVALIYSERRGVQ